MHSRKPLTQEPVRFVLFLLLLGGASASGGYSQSGFPLVRINTPYVQTPQEVVSAMLALAHVTSKDVVYDLGCGDGVLTEKLLKIEPSKENAKKINSITF